MRVCDVFARILANAATRHHSLTHHSLFVLAWSRAMGQIESASARFMLAWPDSRRTGTCSPVRTLQKESAWMLEWKSNRVDFQVLSPIGSHLTLPSPPGGEGGVTGLGARLATRRGATAKIR